MQRVQKTGQQLIQGCKQFYYDAVQYRQINKLLKSSRPKSLDSQYPPLLPYEAIHQIYFRQSLLKTFPVVVIASLPFAFYIIVPALLVLPPEKVLPTGPLLTPDQQKHLRHQLHETRRHNFEKSLLFFCQSLNLKKSLYLLSLSMCDAVDPLRSFQMAIHSCNLDRISLQNIGNKHLNLLCASCGLSDSMGWMPAGVKRRVLRSRCEGRMLPLLDSLSASHHHSSKQLLTHMHSTSAIFHELLHGDHVIEGTDQLEVALSRLHKLNTLLHQFHDPDVRNSVLLHGLIFLSMQTPKQLA